MQQKVSVKVGVLIIILMALTAGAFIYKVDKYDMENLYQPLRNQIKKKKNKVACTMEAKLCSDGTYVSRSGPNCEFAACPEVKKNECEDKNKTFFSIKELGIELLIDKTLAGDLIYNLDKSRHNNLGYAFLSGKSIQNALQQNMSDNCAVKIGDDLLGSIGKFKGTPQDQGSDYRGYFNDKLNDIKQFNGFFVAYLPPTLSCSSAEMLDKQNTLLERLAIKNNIQCAKLISEVSDWQNYLNDKYRFTLTFPETWKGYAAVSRQLDWGSDGKSDSIDFGFPVQKDGLFNISFHTKEQYDSISSSFAPFGQKLGESNGYVFAWDQAQYAANSDMEKRMSEISDIIKTFKLIN